MPDAEMVAALNAATGDHYLALSESSDKVRLYTRIPAGRWQRRQNDPLARMAIWSVKVGKHPGILLTVAHFVSKNYETPGGQAMLTVELAKEIMRVEDTAGHHCTVLVGDLNMNPFEDGVIGAPALHAVMTTQLASRQDRVVQGKEYRFFYNPMWGLFGDRTAGPAGTYYHRSSMVGELFWHMFDQVLLRPELMHNLRDLAILDSIDGELLVTQPARLPRVSVCSDHLPLAFRLDLD